MDFIWMLFLVTGLLIVKGYLYLNMLRQPMHKHGYIIPVRNVNIPFEYVLIRMMMINLYYNSSSLDRHELDAELEFPGYFMTCATVFFLTIVTLGLYLPAAKVRLTHYVADHMTFIAVGSIDDFVRAEREAVSALGEEFGEVFDFDIGSLA